MSTQVPRNFDPVRRCAGCRAVIPADAPTLHCAECHRTDPELIVAAVDYRMRMRARERAELRSASRTPGRVG